MLDEPTPLSPAPQPDPAPTEAPPKSAAQCLDDIEATLDDAAVGHLQIRALLNVVRGLLPKAEPAA